jgi:hypothetical protein
MSYTVLNKKIAQRALKSAAGKASCFASSTNLCTLLCRSLFY